MFQAVFTPWTLLKGLIQKNPIRLSSFPQTAILVLLAQTGARYSVRVCAVVPPLPSDQQTLPLIEAALPPQNNSGSNGANIAAKL